MEPASNIMVTLIKMNSMEKNLSFSLMSAHVHTSYAMYATSFLPNRQEKSTISHNEKPVKFAVPFDMDQIFSSCHPVSFLPDILQFTELEKVNSINKKISKFSQIIMECICCPQNMTRMTFPRTLVAANLLILILPFEAVAETCEPSNSLFNMPLLFGIALIGATVGGKTFLQCLLKTD